MRRRRVARRVFRWAFATFGAVSIAFLLAIVAVLGSLDSVWAKGRVARVALEASGFDVTYDSLEVRATHLELRALVVASPAPLRRVAPEFLRVGRIRVDWSPSRLLRRAPTIRAITIADVAATLTIDDEGKTTFDALPARPPSPPSPAVPLSKKLTDAFATRLPFTTLTIAPIALSVVRTHLDGAPDRLDVHGLEVAVDYREADKTVSLRVGSKAAPRPVTITEDGPSAKKTFDGQVRLALEARPTGADVEFDVLGVRQTFAPTVAADHWVHLEASAAFDAKAGKTVVTLTKAIAGDDTLHAEAVVEIPDVGDPVLRHAVAEVDAARVLRWLPGGWVPVSAATAHARAVADACALAPLSVCAGGTFDVQADLANVVWTAEGQEVHVDQATLQASVKPADKGGSAHVALEAKGVRARFPGAAIDVPDLTAVLEAQRYGEPIDAHLTLKAPGMWVGGGTPVAVHGLELDVDSKRLTQVDEEIPVRGDFTLRLAASSGTARLGPADLALEGLRLRAHTALTGKGPLALQLEAPVARLQISTADGATQFDGAASLETSLRDVTLARNAVAIRGHGAGTAHIADVDVTFDADKEGDAFDYTVSLATPTLGLARPWLPPATARDLSLDRLAANLRSRGRLTGALAGRPSIDHRTEVSLLHASYRGSVANELAFVVESKGDAQVHRGTLDLRARGLRFAQETPSDDHVTATFGFERPRRAVEFAGSVEGRATATVSLEASFDTASRTIPYSLAAKVDKLGAMRPLLEKAIAKSGIELDGLALVFSSKGTVVGLVDAVSPSGVVTLAVAPTKTAWLNGHVALGLRGFTWADETSSCTVPALDFHGELHAEADRRTLTSRLDAPTLHASAGTRRAAVTSLHDEATLTVQGDLLDPVATIDHTVSVEGVKQDFVLGYPVGASRLASKAERERDGIIHLSTLVFTNEQAGTRAELSGNVEVAATRRRLALAGAITQDLARLSEHPELFEGKGTVAIDATVTSPDFSRFRIRAGLKATDVSFRLPQAHASITSANGDVPVSVDVALREGVVEIVGDETESAYSMLRFADQHPLMSRSGFLSVARIETPFVTVAPLAGNLSLDRHVVSLRQFEAGVRGGTITGQSAIDWQGARSTAEIHVRATGVQSSHGEPFDGNIAVVVSAADRSIEGRADILRIGPRHFLDLLALADPTGKDPGMNRIRSVLALGYPDRVRLSFDHGFANARIDLGGLARFVTIDEIRGIPTGPILNNVIDNALPPDDKRAP